MKAYLVTILILTVLAIATQKRETEPVSDGVLVLAFFLRVGLIVWTIKLLLSVSP